MFMLLSSACGSGFRAVQEFDGIRAYEYVQTQVSFGPRIPNTAGHRQTGDWILERLRATADSVEEQAFVHVTRDGDSLALRNLIGRFRPEMSERILYVAHWDTRPGADQSANLAEQRQPVPGANDGASGVAVLLGVADALARTPPVLGVDLVFVDGEDYGDFGQGDDVLIGSRYYAAQLDADAKPLFAVVWDMVGDRNLRIEKEPNSVNYAPEVVRRVWSKARELGYGRAFRNSSGGAVLDDHIPLQQAGVRAIVVIDFDYDHWHLTSDTIEQVSAESLAVVGSVALGLVR
jgi:Zn-dependent M28 family amino/carboxypeptidase